MGSSDEKCVAFLQWALPQIGFRWKGFRKVRRQVCRRIRRRFRELGLANLDAYRELLVSDPEEWHRLERLCRVTISRFFRDREVYRRLGDEVLLELAATARNRGASGLRCWSAGCASGEEPYSLAILWRSSVAARFPEMTLSILATDWDLTVLARARRARYEEGSLREMPGDWRREAFEERDGGLELGTEHRERVSFAALDIRQSFPATAFDLILCRNLAFTYYDERSQRQVGQRLIDRMVPGGYLVVGSHESVPEDLTDHQLLRAGPSFYRRPV